MNIAMLLMGCVLGQTPSDPNRAKAAEREFVQTMLDLQKKHQLPKMSRYDSKRFTAISNASEKFTNECLQNCEVFFDHFLIHFQAKGFKVKAPTDRLMVSAFHSPEGFEAYLGQKVPSSLVGLYHTPTNRLVVYDLAKNRALAANKDQSVKKGMSLRNPTDQISVLGRVERVFNDFAKDANLSTTMHECAHQICFNSGMLNRRGEPPLWVVEGLATYCEATTEGDWTALGTVNPMRISDLRRANGKLLPLETLVGEDRWLRSNDVIVGYAQSWALVHMLMKENPAKLRQFLELIYPRGDKASQLADFRTTFGDPRTMEVRYQTYVRKLLADEPVRTTR